MFAFFSFPLCFFRAVLLSMTFSARVFWFFVLAIVTVLVMTLLSALLSSNWDDL